MATVNNEIIKAELKLGKAENNVSETIVQLEALDLVLRDQTIQTAKTDLSVEDAIEILRESEFIKKARNHLVQYEANQRTDVKHYRQKVNRLKSDRYDATRVWLNEEIDKVETRLTEKKYRQENFTAIDTRRAVLEQVFEFLEGPWLEEEDK